MYEYKNWNININEDQSFSLKVDRKPKIDILKQKKVIINPLIINKHSEKENRLEYQGDKMNEFKEKIMKGLKELKNKI